MKKFDLGAARSAHDLRQILALQQANLAKNISEKEAIEQGFVTVEHDLPTLLSMADPHGHTVARDALTGQIVGYALTMERRFGACVRELEPMFELFGQIGLDERDYVVMGQICVARDWRGMGVLDGLYRAMAERFAGVFELIVTEVAVRNARSLRAHERAGFRQIHRFIDPVSGEDWAVVSLPTG